MWESRRGFGEISKGLVERVGKPAFGFPTLSTAPAFPQLLRPWIFTFRSAVSLSLGLLVLLSLLYSIAGHVQFDDHAMVHEPGSAGSLEPKAQDRPARGGSAPDFLQNDTCLSFPANT
jgi:hypothetical protein